MCPQSSFHFLPPKAAGGAGDSKGRGGRRGRAAAGGPQGSAAAGENENRTRVSLSLLGVYPPLYTMVRTESTGRVPKKTGGGTAGVGHDRKGDGEREGEPQKREGRVGAGERHHEGGALPAQRWHEGKL